jgi:hypothetical protein
LQGLQLPTTSGLQSQPWLKFYIQLGLIVQINCRVEENMIWHDHILYKNPNFSHEIQFPSYWTRVIYYSRFWRYTHGVSVLNLVECHKPDTAELKLYEIICKPSMKSSLHWQSVLSLWDILVMSLLQNWLDAISMALQS